MSVVQTGANNSQAVQNLFVQFVAAFPLVPSLCPLSIVPATFTDGLYCPRLSVVGGLLYISAVFFHTFLFSTLQMRP